VKRLRTAAAGAAAAALLVAYAPAAGADTITTGAPALGHITLLEQPAWSALRADVPVKVRIEGDPNRLTVQWTMHNSVGTRSAFDDTVQGSRLGGRRGGGQTVRVSRMPGEAGVYTILGLSAPTTSGVYPLEITLNDAATGVRIDGFVSYIISVPAAVSATSPLGEPLRLSWVWPFAANPAYRPNGSPDPAVVNELRPSGRLGRLASLLASTDVPITVAPSPETLEAMSTLAETDQQVAASLHALRTGTRPVLAGPYVPIDVPSLVAAGIKTEVGSQLAVGGQASSSALMSPSDTRTISANPVDRDALNQLSLAGVDRVIVDPAQLESVSSRLTPARPFQLQSDGRTFTAAATDPGLTDLLTVGGAPALRAQRFLAGLATIQREAPGEVRGVVVEMPSGWSGDADTTTAASFVAHGLRGNPFVSIVGVASLFDSVQLQSRTNSRVPLIRQVKEPARIAPAPVTARELRTASARLDAFRRLVPADDPRIKRGERALLVAMSSVWTGTQGRRRASQELGVIDSSVSQYVRLIRGPQQTTVTITARKASIPISFQNAGTQPVTVRVRLQSEKLFFPTGPDHVLTLAPHNTTARFAVETRASGTFPLVVTVSSADGAIVFQQTRFTVRSTVVSGVGLFLTLGAGLFLAGWWGNHYRRRRRGQRDARASGSVPVVPAPEALPSTAPTAPTSGSVG
jgi:Family of unknown function (DUF6049)